MRGLTKNKILTVLVIILLVIFFVVPFLFADVDPNSVFTERNLSAPIFYGVALLLSAAGLVFYIIFNKRKYLWILLLIVSIIFTNIGYLALSLSSNVSEALFANRISYFGNVYMLLFLVLTVINACGIFCRKSLIILLFVITSIMFCFTVTQGYLDMFYRNVDFAIVDGFAKIIKDYGPMHSAYIIYVFLYFLLIVAALIYSACKKTSHSIKYSIILAIMGFVNVAIWISEKFFDNNIEYLALSYIINEFILIWIYSKMLQNNNFDTFVIKMTLQEANSSEKTVDLVVSNTDNSSYLVNKDNSPIRLSHLPDDKLLRIIDSIENSEKLSEREKDVAVLLLKDLKRKEMASSLFISENTIKTHTSNIFGKLEVKSRKELQNLAKSHANNEHLY